MEWKGICKSTVYFSPYLNKWALRSALNRLMKQTNIHKLNPYIFRKTYGCIMAEAGVDRGQLAELMRHSVATGEKYYISVRHQFLQKSAGILSIKKLVTTSLTTAA